MTLPLVYTGRVAGDGTGDPGKTAFDKINAWLSNLAAAISSGSPVSLTYASTTLTTNTANFTLGGSFPSGVILLDLLLTSADVHLSGMQAGTYNGQTMWIRNSPSSTKNLLIDIENTGSSPANRFSGSTGTLALIAGNKEAAVYNTTLARWVI